MNTISKSALAALTLSVASFAGQAQAHTEWRFSFKGSTPPYAVPHEHNVASQPYAKRVAGHVKAANKTRLIR